MLDSLAGVALSSKEDRVGPSRCAECKLVEGERLPTCVENTLFCCTCVSEGCDGQFGYVKEPDVVCDGSDDDDYF